MRLLERVAPGPGDVVAADVPPGPRWLDLVAETWAAGATLLPLEHGVPVDRTAITIERARPTILLDPAGARRVDGEPAEPAIGLIVASSGTGGAPRLVQLERTAIEPALAASAERLGAGPSDRWLCVLPPWHIGGLLVLLRAATLGLPIAVHPRFEPGAVAAEESIAFTSLVPTMLGRLLEAGVDLGRFRAIVVGGAALPADLRARAERAGARLVETYGLTETCGGVVYDGVPFPGTQVRLGRDADVELRGPTLMAGYRFDPEATAAAFTDDGWLRTADAGAFDAEGRLRVVGRLDDLISSGGEKVWPSEVEDALRGHPAVRDVVVAGRPDPEWGEHVTAWVVPSDPSAPPSLEDLRAFAARTLPRRKTPRALVLVAELPRTASGKLRRAALSGD